MCQNFFNQTNNPESAIQMIKSNQIIVDNAVEMSDIINKVHNDQIKKNRKSKEAIKAKGNEMKNFMLLASADRNKDKLNDILNLVFNADEDSIKYLRAFSQMLSMSVSHIEQFSEKINVDMKRTRLLKRALHEMTTEEIDDLRGFSDFSERAPASGSGRTSTGYSPLNVNYLDSSDDESARKRIDTKIVKPSEPYSPNMNAYEEPPRDVFQKSPAYVSNNPLANALQPPLEPVLVNGVPTFDIANQRKGLFSQAPAPVPASVQALGMASVGNSTTDSETASLTSNEPTTPAPKSQVLHGQSLSENTTVIPTDSGSSAHMDVDDPPQNMFLENQKQKPPSTNTSVNAKPFAEGAKKNISLFESMKNFALGKGTDADDINLSDL